MAFRSIKTLCVYDLFCNHIRVWFQLEIDPNIFNLKLIKQYTVCAHVLQLTLDLNDNVLYLFKRVNLSILLLNNKRDSKHINIFYSSNLKPGNLI